MYMNEFINNNQSSTDEKNECLSDEGAKELKTHLNKLLINSGCSSSPHV